MKIALYHYCDKNLKRHNNSDTFIEETAQLVLCFSAKAILSDSGLFSLLKDRYPVANIVTCSTAGEIFNTEVYDNTATISVIQFATTKTSAQIVRIEDYANSFDAGIGLTKQFNKEA